MTNLHSSGIEEYKIYSSGSSRSFEELYVLKFAAKLPVYYKKSHILHKFSKNSKIPSEISNSITCFDCPHYKSMRKSDKSPRKYNCYNDLLFNMVLILKKADFTIFEVLKKFWRGLEDPRSDRIYSSGN